MHVLFITGEFPPMQGGVGDCTNEIARALAERGVEVTVLTNDERRTTDDGRFGSAQGTLPNDEGRATSDGRRMTDDRQRIESAQGELATGTGQVQVLRTVKRWDWSALGVIRRAISETNADIFHIQYQTGAFGMHPMINFAPRWLAARRVRAKSVVTFHDLLPMYLFPKAGRMREWVTFQLARTSDAVIATNQGDYNALVDCNLPRLSVIPIGSNIDPTVAPDFNREQLRTLLGVKRDEILLCYFGFLNESKGGVTLVRALAEIPNAKLLMLGGQTGGSDATNAAYMDKVEREIRDLQLEGRVIWTDFLSQSQVSEHFRAADVCVLPYRDGASYRRGTFMAALAHGMAIVTTKPKDEGQRMRNKGVEKQSGLSLPELRDGENVLLVPPDDSHAIADAVQRIAASPEQGARLKAGARETAQFFTWDRIADAHLELYKQLLVG